MTHSLNRVELNYLRDEICTRQTEMRHSECYSSHILLNITASRLNFSLNPVMEHDSLEIWDEMGNQLILTYTILIHCETFIVLRVTKMIFVCMDSAGETSEIHFFLAL